MGQLLRRFIHLQWVVALALLVQLTGAMHLAADLLHPATETEECAGCGDEDCGLPCPPMCATCVGSHSARPALPGAEGAEAMPVLSEASSLIAFEAMEPDEPCHSDIFHPPRLS